MSDKAVIDEKFDKQWRVSKADPMQLVAGKRSKGPEWWPMTRHVNIQ